MGPQIRRIVCFGFIWLTLCLVNMGKTHHLYVQLISDPEIFTRLDSQVYKNLTQAVVVLPSSSSKTRQLVELYLKDYRETSECTLLQSAIGNEEDHAPQRSICTYRLLRRMKLLQDLMAHKSFRLAFALLTRTVIHVFWKNGWPHYEDLEFAIVTILRLQTVNKFDAQEFISSPLGAPTNLLRSGHCYEIGYSALKIGKHFSAIKWLELAMENVLIDKEASAPFIDFALWTAIKMFLSGQDLPQSIGPSIRFAKVAKYSLVSPRGLESLVKFEWKMYTYIKYKYEKARNKRSSTIREELDGNCNDVKMYLQDFEDSTEKLIGKLDNLHGRIPEMVDVSKNILAAYKVVARIREFFQRWLVFQPANESGLMLTIASILNKVYKINDGPDQFDFESTLFAILNIQYIYDLSAKDVADGYVNGVNANVTLRARDCFAIGKYGVSLKFYTLGVQWLEHAMFLVQFTSDDSIKYGKIYDELEAAIRTHDEEHPKMIERPLYFYKPLSEVREPSRRVTRKSIQYTALTITDNRYLDTTFCGVCNGRIQQTAKMKSKLFCWYEREIHPSFKIGPIKVELHSMYPKIEVVQYYDILSDEAMEALKHFSSHEVMDDVMMMESYGVMARNPLQKLSIIPWYTRNSDKEDAKKLAKLVNRLTGLQTVKPSGIDEVRVTAYTPGRFAARHTDKSRATTFILYMSDVKKGGETAFVNAAVKIAPRKGSAVFWHNQYSSGEINDLTEHGSCPVISGIKWTAVFLGVYYERQHHHQCHLERKSAHEILVNGKSKYIAW